MDNLSECIRYFENSPHHIQLTLDYILMRKAEDVVRGEVVGYEDDVLDNLLNKFSKSLLGLFKSDNLDRGFYVDIIRDYLFKIECRIELVEQHKIRLLKYRKSCAGKHPTKEICISQGLKSQSSQKQDRLKLHGVTEDIITPGLRESMNFISKLKKTSA
jgi:hypothetical protein